MFNFGLMYQIHTNLHVGNRSGLNKGMRMNITHALILVIHPIAAIFVMVWLWNQYGWRTRSTQFKGEERLEHIKAHVVQGERLLILSGAIILLGFLANAIIAYLNKTSIIKAFIPNNLHGVMGPVGFVLLYIVVRYGRHTELLREEGASFASQKVKHGRASDLVMYLMFFHAFLGFLYVVEILTN